MAENYKVLVIDDHPLFRAALELALRKSKNSIENIHSVSTVKEGIAALSSGNFSLVLLDLNLSDSKDFEGLSKIRSINQSIPVIIVSATESKRAFTTAISLKASGYIPKSYGLEEMTNAIDLVMSGQTAFPENTSATDENAANRLASLTPAQQRVMGCLSDGLLNKQIAFEMGISEATVKAHMTAIFRKLGANNRTQALLVFRDATRLNA